MSIDCNLALLVVSDIKEDDTNPDSTPGAPPVLNPAGKPSQSTDHDDPIFWNHQAVSSSILVVMMIDDNVLAGLPEASASASIFLTSC